MLFILLKSFDIKCEYFCCPFSEFRFRYESCKKDNGASRVILAGYASLVRFYKYPDKIRPRIAQILLLPHYRGVGIGAKFLKAIYNDLIQDPKVADITGRF